MTNTDIIETFNTIPTAEITLRFNRRELIEGYMLGYIGEDMIEDFDLFSGYDSLIAFLEKKDNRVIHQSILRVKAK